MGFFSKLTQFGGWATNVVQKTAPLVTMVNPAIGMGMSTIGGLGAAAFSKPPASTSLALAGGGGGIFTPASMGSSLPNLGIYTPPGGLPKPTTAASPGVYQEAGIASSAGAIIKALSPAARALASRGAPWIRANWKWLASLVGTTVLTELAQWLLHTETRKHRRMNVLNPRALRRALRRTHGFATYAKRAITLERHGFKGVKFKHHRKRAA